MSNAVKSVLGKCFIFLVSLSFPWTSYAQEQVQESLLYIPVVGQGMGHNIQDLVDIEVSRYGDVITVKRQGKIVFQGIDTTSTQKFSIGKIAITSRPHNGGPALDEISVSKMALPPPAWAGPVDQTDCTFYFNEGEGNLIHSAEGQHWGEVELGWGYKSGEWVDDGVQPGNKSWASWIGSARIHRVTYSSQFTLECFFKIPSTNNLPTGERVALLYMQIQGNNPPSWMDPALHRMVQPEQPEEADWERERGGLNVWIDENHAWLGYEFLSTWRNPPNDPADPPNTIYGADFSLDEWHHVAIVRDGATHTLYLDGVEAGSCQDYRYGAANLFAGTLSIAQNTDHDYISYRSNAAYLLVDQIRLTSDVLEPAEFLTGAEPAYVPPEEPDRLPVNWSDNFDDGNADGWTPDSADNWRITDGVYYVYKGNIPNARDAAAYMRIASIWEDCWLDGDFTIYARMGISPTAQMEDPDDPTNMNMGYPNGDWYRRNYALAFCYQDGFDSYLANFYAHGGWYTGILKYYLPQPEISLWQDDLYFGDVTVGETETIPLVIENTGDADLVINSITGDNPSFQYYLNQYSLPHTLTPEPHGDTMSVWVAFMPTEPGFQVDTLIIECNDPNRPVVYVPVGANARIPLPTETANVSDDFGDGAFDGWTTDDPNGWEVAEGVMQQPSPLGGSGNLFNYYAKMDAGEICGDFTLTLDLGFNENAYAMLSPDELSWEVFGRNFAFGIIQDEYNGLLATTRRAYGNLNGIVKIRNGSQSWLYRFDPGYWFGSQGMGLDIHDLRQMKMSRNGDVITVWADGQVIYQAIDETSSEPINAGWVVVSTRGPIGVRFDNVVLTPVPEPVPALIPPVEKTDFTLNLEEGEGHLITSEEGYRGTVETGWLTNEQFSGPFMGYWVDDGLLSGNKSWAAAAGQMTAVRNLTMGPEATIEGWFKFFKDGGNIFSVVFNGHWINPDWARERSWLSIHDLPDETQVLSFWLQGGTQITGEYVCEDYGTEIPVNIEYDEWTHLAWVREGSTHKIYVNFQEVGSLEMPRWGSTTLTGVQLTVGNAADHDAALQIGDPPYAYVDRIKVTSEAKAFTPPSVLEEIAELIAKMAPSDFDNPAHQEVLLNQIEDLLRVINDLNPVAAIARLNNVKSRIERWITLDVSGILSLIDNLIVYFESQSKPGKGKGGASLSAASLPDKFQLLQNHPNPFNPSTSIRYDIPEGENVYTTLSLYNTRGQLVKTLVNGQKGPGSYVINWDGRDENGRMVPSGVYFYRIQAGEFVQTRKMILLK